MDTIDLNCDMGESFGNWQLGDDAKMLEIVSSVNIACGFHAGDPTIMRLTVEKAVEKGVAIGAHPGFPDLQGFGRRAMNMSPDEIYDMLLYQISALAGIAASTGGRLHHVKPHGALYNIAAANAVIGEAVIQAVKSFNPALILMGLAGSPIIKQGREAGLKMAEEIFADRTYQSDGSLTLRSQAGALIDDPDEAAKRIVEIIRKGRIISQQGSPIDVHADTICIHGDGNKALESADAIQTALREAEIQIESIC